MRVLGSVLLLSSLTCAAGWGQGSASAAPASAPTETVGLQTRGAVSSATGIAKDATHDRANGNEVVLPNGTKIPLILKQAIDTKNSREGDGVYAETTFPIALNNRILVPAGTFVQGRISSIKKAGVLGGRAEIMMHFTTLIFPSGYTVLLPGTVQNIPGADTRMKGDEGTVQGKGPVGTDSVGTIAGAAGTGALIGAVTGGGKGALTGGLAGAAVGTVIGILSRDKQIHLPTGTSVEMVIQRDVTLDGAMLPHPAK